MTPEERLLLVGTGEDLIRLGLISNVVGFLFYGISISIFLWVMISHIRSKERLSSFWGTLILVSLSFVVSTVNNTLILVENIQMCRFLMNITSLDEDIIAYDRNVIEIEIAGPWIMTLPGIFNDCFIIWRAWILFQRRNWAQYLAISLCFTTIAMTVAGLSLQSTPTAYVTAISSFKASAILNDMGLVLSLITNLVATAIIGWILWGHLKFLKKNLEYRQQQQFRLSHILALLMDSGAIYCFIQLGDVIYTFAGSETDPMPVWLGYTVIDCIYRSISFVYPAWTIFLIRGPFSVAGVHETVMSLQSQSNQF